MKIHHNAIVAAIVAALLGGCTTTTAVNPNDLTLVSSTGYTDFIPQDPQPSPMATFFDSSGKEVTKPWTNLTNDQIQNILSNTHAQITVGKFAASGNLTYLVAKATGSVGTYRVVMDYCEYVAETVTDQNTHQPLGQGRVGIGLRLTADVTTASADINLGSLFALGVAASNNQLRGTMTVDSIGIRIKGSAAPVLTNATIDETSIQKTLEAIAVIESKIADPTTVLTPQLLAVKPSALAVKPAEVANKLL